MSNDEFEGRREFLTSAGWAWAVTGLGLPLSFALPGTADAQAISPPMWLPSIAKIMGSTVPADIRWWISGQLFLCRPGGEPLLPLVRTETVSIERWTPASDGWRVAGRDIGYYADVRTGQPLERWTNPLGGTDVATPTINDGPRDQHITRATEAADGRSLSRQGDEMVVTEQRRSDLGSGPGGAEFSLVSHYSALTEIDDARRSSAAANMVGQTVFARCPGWMKMPDRAGFLYGRFYGTKVLPGAPVDPAKRAFLNRYFPGLL